MLGLQGDEPSLQGAVAGMASLTELYALLREHFDSGSALKKMIRDGTNKALMHSLGLDRKTSRGR